MDHIDAHLATASKNLDYSPAIRASVALGKAHLNKYYDMTDTSEVYRIAMSEHPSPNHLFTYNYYVKQSYIPDTNYNTFLTPTGTTNGSPPQLKLFTMSLYEHMLTMTSLSTRSFKLPFTQQRYV